MGGHEELVAIIAAVPATIAAAAAWRGTHKNRRDMRTNHGKRPGEYLEQIDLLLSAVGQLRIGQSWQQAALDAQTKTLMNRLAEHELADDVRFVQLERSLQGTEGTL